jgi:hypothetical protein
MRRLPISLLLLALVASANQATARERWAPKRYAQSAATVQSTPSDQAKPGPTRNNGGAVGGDAQFRAERLIPDICKGCSS